MATTISEAVTTIPAGTLRLLLTSISYRAEARKELRRKPPMVPRRSAALLLLDCSAGLAWSAMCCTVWRGSVTVAHPCTLIYLIIIGRLCWPVQRPAWRWYLWYMLEALRRCDTLQRGTGGIIAACVGLVSAVVEWGKFQEKPL